ncbi:MAG: hypothetical protein WA896_11610 [Spirulinaceae cyanobacterium]
MENYIAILLTLCLNSSSCVIQEDIAMPSETRQSDSIETIAQSLTEAGYSGLFLQSDRSLSTSIWQNGENRIYLEHIVKSSNYSDLTRLLASEVLYANVGNYPPEEWRHTLAYIYSKALGITGSETGNFEILGNQWGFMYHAEEQGAKDYGELGTHLIETGTEATPYLTELLDNSETIFYEGSQEATLGNSLEYRVKDAAAYFIGQITGIPVVFHEQHTDRDAEIERLKETLDNRQQGE